MSKRLKLSHKMLIGFALIVTPFLVSIGIYHESVLSSGKAYLDLMKHELAIASSAQDVRAAMLQCRRDEKDFLLRKDKKYLDAFSRDIDSLKKHIDVTGKLALSSGRQEIVTQASELSASASEYEKAFKELYGAWEMRGLDHESGLQGQFRKIVHTMEESFGKLNLPEASILLLQVRRNEKDYLLRGDEKYVKGVHEISDKLLGSLKRAEVPEESLSQLSKSLDVYKAGFDALTAEDSRIAALTEKMRKAVHQIEPVVESIHTEAIRTAAGKTESVSQQAGFKARMALLMSLGAVAFSVLLAFLITRSITRPVNRVASGLNDGAEQIASSSIQISSASQQLAEGASEQAASTEEASSSLEELSSMTRQNADNANEANSLGQQVGSMIQQADLTMSELAQSMADISNASAETQKILKTIDDIAFQTNLLALNAAVEAARAGEAGAGFAVVADEVRNLAMRAAEAARSTNALLESTAQRVKKGSELAEKTSQAFKSARSASGKVGELIAEIAFACTEQAQGIEQINRAMSEIDKVVQASAAGAEESASASEQLSSQALQMKEFAGELMDLVGGKCGRNRQAKKPAHSNRAVGELSPASFRCRSQQGLSSVLRDPGPPPETRGGDVAPDFS